MASRTALSITGRRISGFEVMEADGLVASSQGHFDSSEYHRQLERAIQEPQ
jgi:hypothetical protein